MIRKLEIEIAKRKGWRAIYNEAEQSWDLMDPDGDCVLPSWALPDSEESVWQYAPQYHSGDTLRGLMRDIAYQNKTRKDWANLLEMFLDADYPAIYQWWLELFGK
jgi:hypothetical protein